MNPEQNNKTTQASSTNTRSRRIIKKVKEDDSFVTDLNDYVPDSEQNKKYLNHKKKKNDEKIYESNPTKQYEDEDFDEDNYQETGEIVMEGNIFYRYSLNQIEIEGIWGFSTEQGSSRFSYLFKPLHDIIPIPLESKSFENQEEHKGRMIKNNNQQGSNLIKIFTDFDEAQGDKNIENDINNEGNNNNLDNNIQNNNIILINNDSPEINNNQIINHNNNFSDNKQNSKQKQIPEFENDKIILYLCPANIYEILLIPNADLFNYVLDFMSGGYHGFFVYFTKTIEDRFDLNFVLEDNQVRVSGKGINNLGEFNIIGYVNFFTIKEQLLVNNSLDSPVINFGTIRITRMYHNFDSSENNRVIKSFQHSRKKFSNRPYDY